MLNTHAIQKKKKKKYQGFSEPIQFRPSEINTELNFVFFLFLGVSFA